LTLFTEGHVKNFEDIGLRPVGIYLPSNATGLEWKKAYPDPEFRWSTTTLAIKQSRYFFENAATMLGRTHIKDSETGKYYNLNALDTDSLVVHNRLSISIEQILSDSSWEWVTDKLRNLLKSFLSTSDVVNGDYSQSLLDIFRKRSLPRLERYVVITFTGFLRNSKRR
jgi:hypothetical protein